MDISVQISRPAASGLLCGTDLHIDRVVQWLAKHLAFPIRRFCRELYQRKWPARMFRVPADIFQVIIFGAIWIAYRVRDLQHANIGFWTWAPTRDLSQPTLVQRTAEDPGRSHLDLNIDRIWTSENARKLFRWICVWVFDVDFLLTEVNHERSQRAVL